MTEPLRVLLVDDNPDDRALALRELWREFPRVQAAEVADAAAMQQALAGAEPSLVITDYQLRWSNGLEVLRQVRSRWPECPVVMFTGTGSEEVAVEAMKSGLDDYVLKTPAHLPRLPAAVRLVLEQARHRRELRAAETRYRELFDNVPVGLFRARPDGQLLDANPTLVQILGYSSREALLATNVFDLYAEASDRGRWDAHLAGSDVIRGIERPVRRPDGSQVWIDLTVRAVRDPQGAILHYEGSVQDITERKRLEDQFRQSQKIEAVGRLAGGIAHDFNNLLTAILGYSDLMLAGRSTGDALYEGLSEIRKAGERAASLTRQLLAFSRKQVFVSQVLDLNAILLNMDRMLRRLIGEDIELVTVPDPALRPVRADPGQLEQVVLNLAINSRDAMPRGGKLTIETRNVELDESYVRRHPYCRPGPYILLAISDTGEGMDEQTRAHIFEPFFTTKEPGKGTGLGLAMVYGIVKQSGGSIEVYSERDAGTTVQIYLPVVPEALEEVRHAEEPADLPRGSETVLVVEDDEALRVLARRMLTRLGYHVLEAAYGAEALRLCADYPGLISLLMTDVIMPQMSGVELARQVTALRPGIRILFMSGYTDEAVFRHGLLDPGTAFLHKPFTPAGLAHKVREVLGNS